MKSIQIINILLLVIFCANFVSAKEGEKSQTMAKIIFGEDPNPEGICENECQYLQKFRGLFPLDNDAEVTTDLREFTWKYIYIYEEHLSVFKSKNQNPPKGFPSEEEEFLPKQTEFLNNYPLQSFIRSCDDDLCTIAKFKKFMEESQPGSPFEPNELVANTMGPEADQNCLVLIQDILIPRHYFYICNEDPAMLGQAKLTITEQQRRHPADEFKAHTRWLKDVKENIDIWLHVDDKVMIGNNVDVKISQSANEPDMKEFLSYAMGNDFFKPCATFLKGQEGAQIPWTGDVKDAPELDRCFTLNIKVKNDAGEIEMGHEYICVQTSPDGKEELELKWAALGAQQFVDKLNTACQQVQMQAVHDYCEKCTDEPCEKTLTKDNPMLAPVAEFLRMVGMKVDEVCNLSIQQGLKKSEECIAAKQEILMMEIELATAANEFCGAAIKEGIADGDIPISGGGGKAAWDPENPYRNLDNSNIEVPQPDEPEPIDPELLTPAQKEIEQIKKEIGTPIDEPPAVANSAVRPPLIEIAKAVNTCRQILNGSQVQKLETINQVCMPEDGVNIGRTVALVPFLARFDPWLEYCGMIRDKQLSNGAKKF